MKVRMYMHTAAAYCMIQGECLQTLRGAYRPLRQGLQHRRIKLRPHPHRRTPKPHHDILVSRYCRNSRTSTSSRSGNPDRVHTRGATRGGEGADARINMVKASYSSNESPSARYMSSRVIAVSTPPWLLLFSHELA